MSRITVANAINEAALVVTDVKSANSTDSEADGTAVYVQRLSIQPTVSKIFDWTGRRAAI
jgi:hypothetical protein